jgi:hypothetical protein
MALANQLGQASVVLPDGNVTATVYDKIAVDHIYQLLWRSNIRARKARIDDSTSVTPRDLKDLVVKPETQV